jgi:ABC-2 type transport system permease protein
MATRSIKPKRDDTILTDWQSMPEVAPSSMRTEGTFGAQILLFVGFFLILVGGLAMIAPLTSWSYFINPGPGYVCLTIGLCLTLYHCFVDPEPQFRRMYGLFALTLVVFGVLLRVFPATAGFGAYFLSAGVPALFIALLFLVGVARTETDLFWRTLIRATILGVGAVSIAYGIGRGFFDVDFLLAEGAVVTILGLAYLVSFLGMTSERDGDLGYHVSWALGIAGAGTIAVAIVRSIINGDFFVPSGLILVTVGVVALAIAIANISDAPAIVLARRELLSYFCSPVAYLVIFGLLCIFGFNFREFKEDVAQMVTMRGGLLEPIVQRYVVNFFTIVALLITIPVITMRLLSEENRSGSLEVLLTAPLNESSIVLGKYLAALIFFLIAWAPLFLFLIAFRIFGDQAFDYRPLLSFFLALSVTAAGFIAMGLFFSSLTSNQIIAAVLTFAGVLLALGLHWIQGQAGMEGLQDLISYISFPELWIETSRGNMPLRYFAAHISVAIFFLFLTVLTLSSRKWK